MMLEKRNNENISLGFRDFLLGFLILQLILIISIIPYINPEGVNSTEDIRMPGDMKVEIEWPQDNNVDVDLVIRDPYGEVTFFRDNDSRIFNMLRDDRGKLDDDGDLNYEDAFARGIPDGEYIVNLFLYQINDGSVPVDVDVRVFKRTGNSVKKVYGGSHTLHEVGTETTAIRFYTLGGDILPNTLNNAYEPIMPEIVFSHEMEEDHGP